MNSRKLSAPIVQVPDARADRPSWVKVGAIAALGFAVGVVWPRLAGVRLSPNAPSEASSVASSAPVRAADAPATSAATAAASAVPAASLAQPAAVAANPPTVTVNRGVVLSCRTEDGEALKGFQACGAVAGFDALALPRLKKLSTCAAADGTSGKLSVVFNIDFKSNRVTIDVGRSSTVGNIDGISACLKPQFQGVSLGPLDHQNPKYALLYSAVFASKGSVAAAAPTASPGTPLAPPVATATPDAEGTAQVVWEVAIVRDNPRTGQVVARLQRGTKIRLGAGQDGWYRVQYGQSFASEGWVYRGAIGR